MSEIQNLALLQDVLNTFERVVVTFSAPAWCVPCQRLAPHMKAAAEKLPGIKFVEVDIDKAEDIRSHYDILGVPTVFEFKNAEVVQVIRERTSVALVKVLS